MHRTTRCSWSRTCTIRPRSHAFDGSFLRALIFIFLCRPFILFLCSSPFFSNISPSFSLFFRSTISAQDTDGIGRRGAEHTQGPFWSPTAFPVPSAGFLVSGPHCVRFLATVRLACCRYMVKFRTGEDKVQAFRRAQTISSLKATWEKVVGVACARLQSPRMRCRTRRVFSLTAPAQGQHPVLRLFQRLGLPALGMPGRVIRVPRLPRAHPHSPDTLHLPSPADSRELSSLAFLSGV